MTEPIPINQYTGAGTEPLYLVFSDDSVLMITIPEASKWEDTAIWGTYTALT